MRFSSNELKYQQSLPLEDKVSISLAHIREWHEYWNGNVYLADSGGKDSTVLRNLIRYIYPDVPSVFCNTGLEFPEIINFIKTIDNVIWLRPNHTFKTIVNKFGWPVISKRVAMSLNRYMRTSDPQIKKLRMNGGTNPTSGEKEKIGVIPKKWAYLVDSPFKISEYCCDVMKKLPMKKYNHSSGRKCFNGMMASDSGPRKINHLKYGCNAFDLKEPQSRPLAIWTEADIWTYIKKHNIPYSKIYDKGYDRTGCFACCFGCHMEEKNNNTNRFKIMQKSHPRLWKYCVEYLEITPILSHCGIDY